MNNCGWDPSITWEFKSGVPPGSGLTEEPWTTNFKNRVRDGFEIWEDVKKAAGEKPISITEQSSGEWDIYSVSDLDARYTFGGATTCNVSSNGGWIALDFFKWGSTYVTDDSKEGLAAHEIGHAIGLVHTGIYDSFYHNGEAPTMEGCATMMSNPHTWPNHLNTLEDDDFASAVAKTWNKHVNPNPSFEHGTAPGWKRSGGSWSVPSSGGGLGPRYLKHTGYAKYVENYVTMFDLAAGSLTGRFRSGVRYKEPSSHIGTIKVEFAERGVNYPFETTGCESSQFPKHSTDSGSGGRDLNDPDVAVQYTIRSSLTYNPTTAWSNLTWGSWKAVSTVGAEFRIRVYNYLEDTSGPMVVDGEMHLDTVYVYAEGG